MEGVAFHFLFEKAQRELFQRKKGCAPRSPSFFGFYVLLNLHCYSYKINLMSSLEPTLIVVMTALPEVNQANSIARILVEEKLAACVQVMPSMTSTYVWKGELCHESEHLVLIKTLQTNYDGVVRRLRSLHPYETPEIIAIPAIAVDRDYLSWAISI